MPTVTDQEFENCLNLCSMEAEIYSVAAARMYVAKNGSWEFSGCTGICSVLSDGPSYYIRMFDSNCQKIIFEQELYEGFLYSKASPWFHTFEMNENIGGLSFMDDAEGEDIFENVVVAAEEIGGGAGTFQGSSQQAAPPQVQYNEEPQYEEEYYEEPQQSYNEPPQQSYNEPPQQPYNEPPQQQAPPQQQSPPQQQAVQQQAAPVSNSPNQKNRKKGKKQKKKKKGKFFGLRKKKPKKQKVEIVIGGPTNFQHESHIGWDLDNGFDIRNIPPEWRKLFQAAGVKKSELQDPETRKMIMETVGESMNGGGLPPSGPPGPPPPGPPPPGPPPPSSGPPPPSSGPPPPGGPPTPSRGNSGPPPARELSLQEQLAQKRNKLANANERKVNNAPIAGAPKASLADTLAAAMMARRGAVDVDDEAPEDDDDWSDEDWDDDDW
eukprot:TRINITY_DN222_c0_g1_i5.p1 TRINITY_DN222_c0_g1~~TRINITY_DN222_c0_g1_i5.p1  ORF type:complete len:436 (-),score=268.00 TRINITY_DN222_c0_g1_i5:129-1436(-)